jgi:hypothetical protein
MKKIFFFILITVGLLSNTQAQKWHIRFDYAKNYLNKNEKLSYYCNEGETFGFAFGRNINKKLDIEFNVGFQSYHLNPKYRYETLNIYNDTSIFVIEIGGAPAFIRPMEIISLNLGLKVNYDLFSYKFISVPLNFALNYNRMYSSYGYYYIDTSFSTIIPTYQTISGMRVPPISYSAGLGIKIKPIKRIALRIDYDYYSTPNFEFGLKKARLQYPLLEYSLTWYFLDKIKK